MSSPLLAEGSVVTIQDYIKSNIATELGLVRIERADAKVVLSEPMSYFIYADAKVFKAPAIFVICDDFDFKISENYANFIDGVARINISCVVEDREKAQLTFKTWRYQSALHSLLAQKTLTSQDGKVTLTIVIKRASFSPIYAASTRNDVTESVFRKEVLLECDVVHRENY